MSVVVVLSGRFFFDSVAGSVIVAAILMVNVVVLDVAPTAVIRLVVNIVVYDVAAAITLGCIVDVLVVRHIWVWIDVVLTRGKEREQAS